MGHETNVVFEASGVPKIIESVQLTHSSFKDIHRNQSASLILKKGFSKEQFVLNDENKHTLSLIAEQSKFRLPTKNTRTPLSPLVFILAAVGIFAEGSLLPSNT